MAAVQGRGCAASISRNSRVGSYDAIQICRCAGANLAVRNERLRLSPYIATAGVRNLRFNLSNTTGLVACAVSMDCEIGIDVENITRTVDADAVAPSVFAPAELADFREAGLEDQRERFFSYWTLKESYIKARGMGLSLPLDAFWFELGGTSPLLCVTDRCPDIPDRWRFYQHAPTDEHMMAVAVAAPQGVEPSIHPRWVKPMSLIAESA